ncbi:Hpt domain-containing protein [Polaromonas sp. YR568]|uniref:Hpt domain-containing protein n=1 Tax=Polaromonas sp. YR568 TaxID=1855301 RepID=UPI003137F871
MATTNPALLAFLEQQKAEYRAALPARLATLTSLWAEVQGGTATPATLADLERQAHGLAGSAATFGLAPLGLAARAVELGMEPWVTKGPPLDAATLEAVGRAMTTLLASAREAGV